MIALLFNIVLFVGYAHHYPLWMAAALALGTTQIIGYIGSLIILLLTGLGMGATSATKGFKKLGKGWMES